VLCRGVTNPSLTDSQDAPGSGRLQRNLRGDMGAPMLLQKCGLAVPPANPLPITPIAAPLPGPLPRARNVPAAETHSN
jgi:hypothetical protein